VRERAIPASPMATLGLGVLLALATAFLLHEMRGTTFWVDEWDWIQNRRGGDLDTFLRPHNEHLSVVPIALYKLLFATAGLDQHLPYRALVLVAHLACASLVFVYVRRSVGAVPALCAAALVLFLGPAWQNILWPFQVGSVVSLGAGIGALLLLDRRDRRGDAAASLLLGLSLLTSGIGIVVAIGLVVDVAWGRRRAGDAWIVALPIALYGVWWLAYQDTTFIRHNVVLIPGFAADSAAAALSALAGLGAGPDAETGQTLGWGRPLALAAALAIAWRLARLRPIRARVLTLLAMLLAFWALTALRRAQISTPLESRYLYTSGVLLILLTAELARGVVLTRRALAVLVAVAAVAVIANVGDLRDAGRFLRTQSEGERAVLAALELSRTAVPRDHAATAFPGYPLVVVQAGPYFDAARAYGSPAAAPGELAALPGAARLAADRELSTIHGAALHATGPGAPVATGPPRIDVARGGATNHDGGCTSFRPAGAAPAAEVPELQLTLPAAGLLLKAEGGPATVSLRRFADVFAEESERRLSAGASATLRIPGDASPQPWRVRVAPEGRLTVCALS
jgi:hypothetical protein